MKKKPHIVFLVSVDPLNYKADETIPLFAAELAKSNKYTVTVLQAEGDRKMAYIPNLKVLRKADLFVVFCRRLALQPAQMKMIQKYVKRGKPIIGLRTANHAFSIREEVPEGYVDWWDFVPEVLGVENRGYEPEELGTKLEINPIQKNHEILAGVSDRDWRSQGQVYKVSPMIDTSATILLLGSTENVVEPFAWTRTTKHGGKVFYTALGYPTDFDHPNFDRLLKNAIHWILKP